MAKVATQTQAIHLSIVCPLQRSEFHYSMIILITDLTSAWLMTKECEKRSFCEAPSKINDLESTFGPSNPRHYTCNIGHSISHYLPQRSGRPHKGYYNIGTEL